MMLLMRCATGEEWNLIMFELSSHKDEDCIKNQSYISQQEHGLKGCGNDFAFAYFISFMVIISMLIMNLSVAAVIEGLETARKENSGVVEGDDLDQLIEAW